MHLVLISFMHLSLFSIRELINVITSNYWLVDDDFVKSCNFVQVTSIFMIHFEPIKELSHLLIKLYFICSIVSISFHSYNFMIWWQLKIIGPMWEIRCILCVTWEVFFATLYGAFNLSFWFRVFDHNLWLFSSHGFHILCRLSSISFLVLVLSF